jgi:GNAT superfamily N-acetyltransferase
VELIHLGSVDPADSHERLGFPLAPGYLAAFREIEASADKLVVVAELEGVVVGTFQFAAIPNLSNVGGRVAQVESVHVAPEMRSKGIGEAMMHWAIDEARRRGCFRLQLTSDKRRDAAHRFYERLGFAKSHEGFKLGL